MNDVVPRVAKRPGKFTRDGRLLERRRKGDSTRELARAFMISQTRVVQILDQYGDPLGRPDGLRPEVDIRAELEERRRCQARDAARIRELLEELQVRETDRVLGLR